MVCCMWERELTKTIFLYVSQRHAHTWLASVILNVLGKVHVCTKMLNPYLEPYTCKNVGIERAHYSVEIKDTEAQQLWMRG